MPEWRKVYNGVTFIFLDEQNFQAIDVTYTVGETRIIQPEIELWKGDK